jgi:GNAT superfamily N-acetyltransferase
MTVKVRRAQSDSDFRRLYRLFVAYEADLPTPLRHGRVPNIPAIAETFSPPNAAFIAAHGRTSLGCVALKRAQGEGAAATAVLLRLFVRPQHRRLGAARVLVTSAIAFARMAGFERLVLDTHKGQLEAAYRLYRSLGFEECEAHGEVSYASPTFMRLLL